MKVIGRFHLKSIFSIIKSNLKNTSLKTTFSYFKSIFFFKNTFNYFKSTFNEIKTLLNTLNYSSTSFLCQQKYFWEFKF